MSAVIPLKNKKQIESLKKALGRPRDRMLFVFGLNSGLRISDILSLKVSDVLDKDYLIIREQKTSKTKKVRLNSAIKRELKTYLGPDDNPDDYLFQSRKGKNKPLSRFQAYRILNDAARRVGIKGEIGCHTMRKTFGYWNYKSGVSVSVIQKLFNHSSEKTTLRYIGIEQEELDDCYENIDL